MLRTYFQETFYDMAVDVAQKYAEGIRLAIMTGKEFDGEKQKGFFLSKNRGFEDKLYVGNIHRIESHLYYNDEELADDDQIVNVIVIDGPVTRDGDGCSYGSKDHRDQIMYANTIPQVVGHVFILNTPGGAASARIDYEQAIADCREKGKPTVAWVDGLCCSAGQLVASLCDRTVVMNGRHTMGCIGTMCAFWGVANGTVDRDGYRYIELVSVSSPEKNAEYREATDGKTEKLQAELNRLGEEFRETVRQNRPLVKEEHLTGKTFEAQDVMGALVDETGDYLRAIECVFELAGGNMTAARFVTEPAADAEGTTAGDGGAEEQEDLAQLNDQQKQEISNSHGNFRKVEDGHVKTDVPGFFGPEEVEVAKPKENNDMTEEEKKAAGAEAAQAGAQDAAEQAEGDPAADATGTVAGDNTGAEDNPAGQDGGPEPGNPAADATGTAAGEGEDGEGAGEGEGEWEGPAADAEGTAAGEGEGEGTGEGEGEGTGEGEGEGTGEGEDIADALAEINRITETLHSAEAMVEERDKTIETHLAAIAERDKTIETLSGDMEVLRNDIATKDSSIAEMQATIDRLTSEVAAQKKVISDKESEIKELAGKPTPMTDASSGVPADNGTGKTPKASSRIHSGMSYEEIREAVRESQKPCP